MTCSAHLVRFVGGEVDAVGHEAVVRINPPPKNNCFVPGKACTIDVEPLPSHVALARYQYKIYTHLTCRAHLVTCSAHLVRFVAGEVNY